MKILFLLVVSYIYKRVYPLFVLTKYGFHQFREHTVEIAYRIEVE